MVQRWGNYRMPRAWRWRSARLWVHVWRRAAWRRVVRDFFAPPRHVPTGASSAAQARFWRDFREGQRLADAASSRRP